MSKIKVLKFKHINPIDCLKFPHIYSNIYKEIKKTSTRKHYSKQSFNRNYEEDKLFIAIN